MIVIVEEQRLDVALRVGDTLNLSYRGDVSQSEWTFSYRANRAMTVEELVIYRLCRGDGSFSPGPVSFYAGHRAGRPVELQTAVLFSELTEEKKRNFRQSLLNFELSLQIEAKPGWATKPFEPTDAMLQAAWWNTDARSKQTWKAMYTAAPKGST